MGSVPEFRAREPARKPGLTPLVAGTLLLLAADAASAADLLDVYKQARASDATYAAARATWAATQERIPQGRAGLLPLASISGSAQYTDRSTRFRDASVPRTNI